MPSLGAPPVDPYACYTVPSGFVGVINDLVSVYIFICLVGGRAPLSPKRRLQNQRWTGQFCLLCFGQTEIHNIAIARGCLTQPGAAQALFWITLGRIALLPFLGMIVTGIALQHTAANGRVADGDGDVRDTHTVAEEAGSKASPVVVATTSTLGHKGRYQDAPIQTGYGGPHGYGPIELDNLPSYSVVDPQAMPSEAAEVGKADTQPLGVALEGPTLSPPPIYIPEDNECIDGSGPVRTPPDLESQLDKNQETRSGEASEPLLPDAENANGGPRRNFGRIGTIVGILLIGAIQAGFLAAHISMAIQSIKSGNSNTQVVGIIFFILFLGGITLLLFDIMHRLWKGMRTAPRLSEAFRSVPIRSALILAFIFSSLLVILYEDMNLGVMSGQIIGLGPTTNSAGTFLYWMYIVSTKLPLLCY